MPRAYSDFDLNEAVSSVRRNHLTVSQAAREYAIPRQTLKDHLMNPDLKTRKGPDPQLTLTETQAVLNFAMYMAAQGFPLSRERTRAYIMEIIVRSGRKTLFKQAGPSDEWFRKLIDKHPELSFRAPENRNKTRARMSNPTVIDEFFKFWGTMLVKHGVTDKPAQVFNCDETGWSGKESCKIKVLAPRSGHIHQQQVMTADHVTAHLCVSGDGKFLPPMVIFKGSFPHRSYRDGVPGSWLFATSESGYMDTELFHQWFVRCFIPNCGRARPVLLLMDNHDSHISLPLVESARANNIELVGLPSHTTHLLQPLDVHVNGPLKNKVQALSANIGFARPGASINKARIPVVLSHAMDQTTAASIKEAFRLAGIMPCNRDAIDSSQLVPPTFVSGHLGGNTDPEPVRTCKTCGQFVGQNPLVKRGIIPASLAEILIPPAVAPMPAKKPSSKIVTSGRVITGDEMLESLKEKERQEQIRRCEQEERLKKKEERKEAKMVEDKEREAKKQKRDEERKQKEEQRLKERELIEKYGRLAPKKYTCGICSVRRRVNDEAAGIFWFGCDNGEVKCKSTGWFHQRCLSEGEKLVLVSEDKWLCRQCMPSLYEEE